MVWAANTGLCQKHQNDTVTDVNLLPTFDDTGSWGGVQIGFHMPVTSSYEYYSGPIYKNYIVNISQEFAYSYTSYPIELQYWRWRDGENRTSSILISGGIKLRYPIYKFNIFGQLSIGTGVNILIPINLPYSYGLEYRYSHDIVLIAQARSGLHLGGESGIFMIFGVKLKY